MPQRKEFQAGPWRVVLLDSITQLRAPDQGAVAVSGSHGGSSAAAFALAVPIRLAVFNDAGGGKDAAGVIGLTHLQDKGVAAATVSHLSARIGDAQDTWDSGVITQVNALAAQLGLAPGQRLSAVLPTLSSPP